jgi:hypothetical protein
MGIPRGGTGMAPLSIGIALNDPELVAGGTGIGPGGTGSPLGVCPITAALGEASGGDGSTTGGLGVGPGGTGIAAGGATGGAGSLGVSAGAGGGVGIPSAAEGITIINPHPGHFASRPAPVSAA